MHALHDLKSMLVEELEQYGKKGSLDRGSLETVDTLAHAVKNLCKVIEDCEDEEYRTSHRSYAEDGMSRRRDSRGRYAVERGRSYSDHSVRQLEELMETADDGTRRVIEKALREIRG